MTNKEFKTQIAQAADQEWFKNVSWNFTGTNITGLSAIYEYINQQIEGWEKYETLPQEFTAVKTYFTNVKNNIINFVANIPAYQRNLQQYWQNQIINQPVNRQTIRLVTYNAPEVIFLLKVFSETQQYYQGAYQFLIGNNHNLNSRELLYGAILAYEFTLKDNTKITSRKNAERSSISKLRNDFQKYLTESEQQLSEHLHNANDKFTEYSQAIDNLKTEKEKLFSDWFEETKTDKWQNWYEPALKRVADLEDTYKEKLKLEEPAKYWSERAKQLKTQGWKSFWIVFVFVVAICALLSVILIKTPDFIYASWFGEDKSTAIKWTMVFVTLISFIAYTVRALLKVMFSSFHLSRDCEERHTLTYFYLSLLKDSKVDEKERLLIMQSLFSRAETGLLKDDSSPTMPNDLITKVSQFNK